MVDATPLTDDTILACDDGFLLSGGIHRSPKTVLPRFVAGRKPCSCLGFMVPRKPATIHRLPDDAWEMFSQEILAIYYRAQRRVFMFCLGFILLIQLPIFLYDAALQSFGFDVTTLFPVYHLVVWIIFTYLVRSFANIHSRWGMGAFRLVVSNHIANFANYGIRLRFVEETQSGYIWGHWMSGYVVFRDETTSKSEIGDGVV